MRSAYTSLNHVAPATRPKPQGSVNVELSPNCLSGFVTRLRKALWPAGI